MIKKFEPKLNYQLGPDKGSRITLNILKQSTVFSFYY